MRSHTLMGFVPPTVRVRYNFVINHGVRRKPAFCVGNDKKDALTRLGNILSSCERIGAKLEITGTTATTEEPTDFGKVAPEVQSFFMETFEAF